jgi:hypothetical protein
MRTKVRISSDPSDLISHSEMQDLSPLRGETLARNGLRRKIRNFTFAA